MKDELILQSQVKELYSETQLSTYSAIVLCILMYYLFQADAIYHQFAEISLALVIISYLIRARDSQVYLYKAADYKNQYWSIRFSALALFSAVAWSAFFIALFPQQETQQVLVAFCLAGIGMSSLTVLFYNRRLVIIYLCILFIPLMIRLYLQSTIFSSELLIFCAAFFIFLISTSKKIYQAFIKNVNAQSTINTQNKTLQDHQFAFDQHAIVSVTDIRGNITYVNDKFCYISGFTPEELLGENHNILASGYHTQAFFKQMWQTIAKGDVWHGEIQNKAKNGSKYWVSSTIVPLLNEQGKPQQYIAMRTDVTHFKDLQRQDRSTHESTLIRSNIAQILQETTTFKIRLEQVLKILCEFKGLPLQNKAAVFLLSADEEQPQLYAAHGTFPEEFVTNEQFINIGDGSCGQAALNGAVKILDVCPIDHEHICKGMPAHGHHAFPLSYAGKVLGFLFLYTDPYPSGKGPGLELLTNIGQMIGVAVANEQGHEALIKEKAIAEKANKAKSEFLSSMSHELRTPLNAVLGFSQLLENDEEEPLTEGQKENIGYIIDSGKHLLRLINEVLELSAIEAGKTVISIEPIKLIDVTNECLILLKNKADLNKIQINILAENQTIFVHADYTKLKQILLNLISNAVKYNIDGGLVNIDWQLEENDQIRISITDNGIGISKENQHFVFGSFNRLGMENSDIEGSGIGLLVTKNLVELMDGIIGFNSVEGHGSTFWFELSLAEIIDQKVAAPSLPDDIETLDDNNHDQPHKRVLYVEDNPINRQLMQSFFNKQKHLELQLTDTAEQAWDILTEQTFDLILMDINLPGMDGITFTEILKAEDRLKSIPVIAVTAAAMTSDFKAAKDVFDEYVTKPVDFTELINFIKKYI
ncbi:MAG: hypothetical protein COB23_00570 [Methylophaga sp.]|nr:MAG: hypothetical protein COB23_00570 [Methylophaga sp.]